MTEAGRRAELQERLAQVRSRIAAAATASGRSADDVTLVVVTKTWPTSDIRLLSELGVDDVAENRHPDAEQKSAELAELRLRWHFVGQIQSNKAARIARYSDVVHSVDSVRVAQRLNSGAHQAEREVTCLVQVSLDAEDTARHRGGVAPEQADEVAAAIDTAGGLRLAGVMGVAPLGGDPAAAYASLVAVAGRIRAAFPGATWLSAGMSDDFEEAVTAGATHVRVGSAILGQRHLLR